MAVTLHDKILDFEEPSVDLIDQSESLGIYDPLTKIYTQAFQQQQSQLLTTHKNNLALYLALVTMAQTRKLAYDKKLGILTNRKSSETIDSTALTMGLITVLMQMSPAIGLQPCLSFLCQYLNSIVVSHGATGVGGTSSAVTSTSSSTSVSTSAAATLAKDDDFSAAFIFITQFMNVHPRPEARAIVKLLIPCFEMLSTFVN